MIKTKFAGICRMTNGSSGLLVLGLLIFLALGCSLNAKKWGDTTTEPENTNAKNEEPKDKKPVEKSDASKGEVPSEDEAQELAKETLLEFNKAVQNGDFSDFYDSISKVWQKEISPEKFETAFSEFIEKKVDISEIRSKEADFSPDPEVNKEQGYDMLSLEGSYDTTPVKTRFELKFIPEGKVWKLSRIRVVLR